MPARTASRSRANCAASTSARSRKAASPILRPTPCISARKTSACGATASIPATGAARTLIQPIAPDRIVADLEGLAIITDGAARYLIASSQGDSTFPVWRVDGTAPVWVGRFVVTEGAVDAVTGTDGLHALGGPVGPAFPEGVVVIQDDINDVGTQNFKYVDWRAIKTALGL